METSRTKFLVCVDGREESRKALTLACLQAKRRNGVVDILHVMPPADFQTLGAIADRMRAERREEAEMLLKILAEEVNKTTGITPSFVLREGEIAEEIVAAVTEDPEVSMLVIAVAQPSATRGKLIAWLASQLGNKLLVPLMLVPGNLTDQQLEEIS